MNAAAGILINRHLDPRDEQGDEGEQDRGGIVVRPRERGQQ